MNRIARRFKELSRENRCGFIAYVTCGDPDLGTTREVLRSLEKNGTDFIELGVPFSDPIADGPVIQAASHRALGNGVTIDDVLSLARTVRAESEIPLIAFSYLNPILRYGPERFAAAASDSGIDGLLVTDLPPEAAGQLRRAMKAHRLAMIFLATPTTPDDRLRMIDRMSDGFVYYVSVTGVTGARRSLDESLIDRLRTLKGRIRRPLAVGFGVSTHDHYEALKNYCDAVVVGSAIVHAVATGHREEASDRAGAVVRGIIGRERESP